MIWRQLGAAFDARIGNAAELGARRMTRRNALRTAVLGGAASVAAITLGQSPASADAGDMGCGPTSRCSGCTANPYAACPSGYSLCKGKPVSSCSDAGACCNDEGFNCEWASGTWQAYDGLGFGYGYEICYDCKNSGGCDTWCTCLGTCICCRCTSLADVRAEMKRGQAIMAGR